MIRFLHGADFHLDSAFGALQPGQAAARRRESRELALRMADYVNAHNIDLVLLAGDLFDSASPFRETGEQLAAALGQMQARVFIAPGNHDWYGPGSPWETVPWPEHVTVFRENTLTAAESMTTQDLIPFYDATAGQHKRTTLQALKEAIGVQSPTISVTTCTGASVTCSDGAETTLQGTGSTDFELPHVGTWTVTASLGGESVSEQVQVGGGLLYEVDLMITSGIAVTTQPTKTTYYIGEAFDPAGMVVTATFADDTTANVTEDCEFSPQTMAAGTQSVTVTYQRAGVQKTASVAVAVRVLDHIDVTTEPSKKAYKYGETFNPAGMVVTAYYTDDQSRAVTGYTYSPTGALDMDDTTITISYTEGSVTKQTTQAITVAKVLDSIEITTPPNKTA